MRQHPEEVQRLKGWLKCDTCAFCQKEELSEIKYLIVQVDPKKETQNQ